MTETRDIASPASVSDAVEERLARIESERVVERFWAKDFTVWNDDPREITDRLGWLTVPETMIPEVPRLQSFARKVWDDGFTTAVLLGMGGSSLGPEVMQSVWRSEPRALEVIVLDTTHPDELRNVVSGLDLARTLVIAASKSGSTIETRSQLEYFWHLQPRGDQYVAITDAHSSLEKLAHERGFREVFLNDPEIGGRYSALSFFGMVPAALMGADVEATLKAGAEAAAATKAQRPAENVAVRAGVEMGVAAAAGRDKLTIRATPHLRPFGAWLEQLLSESTGKNGTGILPAEAEYDGVAGDDRMYVDFGTAHTDTLLSRHPGPLDWWNWEFATAVAGHVLGLNPFDQPAVQSAKDATASILAGEHVDTDTPGLAESFAKAKSGDYIALLAYLPRNHGNDARLARLRRRLAKHYGVAVTSGFGPRYLHSTGQYHKGGPNTGIYVLIPDTFIEDVAIPGATYTFGELNTAQALGDLHSLRSLGRRVTQASLEELEAFAAEL